MRHCYHENRKYDHLLRELKLWQSWIKKATRFRRDRVAFLQFSFIIEGLSTLIDTAPG